MNKRKILTLAMALCLIAILAIGGTLAYFTDTAAPIENTVVIGDVEIDLTANYPDDQVLLPGANLTKEGFIKNTGDVDAYARMVVAFEHSAETKNKGGFAAKLAVQYSDEVFYEWFNTAVDHIQLADGTWYSIATFTAKDILEPGDEIMGMARVALDAGVTEDDLKAWSICTESVVNGETVTTMKDIKIHFAAQAVQADYITAENKDAAGTNGAQSNVDEILDLALGDVSTYTAEQLNTLFNIKPAA